MSERVQRIMEEFHGRADVIGLHPAIRELAVALERAELRYDDIEARIRGLIVVTDRRGIFLPPAQGIKIE